MTNRVSLSPHKLIILKTCGIDYLGEEYICKDPESNILYFVRKISKKLVDEYNFHEQLLVSFFNFSMRKSVG